MGQLAVPGQKLTRPPAKTLCGTPHRYRRGGSLRSTGHREAQASRQGAIADRIDAGETVADLAADYDLSVDEIEEAVLYERGCVNLVYF